MNISSSFMGKFVDTSVILKKLFMLSFVWSNWMLSDKKALISGSNVFIVIIGGSFSCSSWNMSFLTRDGVFVVSSMFSKFFVWILMPCLNTCPLFVLL